MKRYHRLSYWIRPEYRGDSREEYQLAARMWLAARRALAAAGREPRVRARYYYGDAWAVSDRPHAAPPCGVGDRHWSIWTPTYWELRHVR